MSEQYNVGKMTFAGSEENSVGNRLFWYEFQKILIFGTVT